MNPTVSKRAKRKAATREVVLDAARAAFLERGYDGTTIAAIAEMAKVSPGTVLNACPSKSALLNAVIGEDFEELGSDCESLSASLSGGVREKVSTLLEQHLARHFDNLDLLSAMFGQCWLGEAEVQEALGGNLQRAWHPIQTLLEEAQDNNTITKECDLSTLVEMMQDVYLGVLRRCLTNKHDMFVASNLMRHRLDVIFSQILMH